MFYDWIKVTQDFPEHEMPILADQAYASLVVEESENGNVLTGEIAGVRQAPYQHKGSFDSSICIRISGTKVTFDGNPSRYGRPDNLFGISTLDGCMQVVNDIMKSVGLPEFTKSTGLKYRKNCGSKIQSAKYSDGAKIQRLDITSNKATGGMAETYIKAVSTQRYRNSVPRLHTNGMGVDWLSKSGSARLMYPKLYEKANEILIHAYAKAKRKHGKDSERCRYLRKLMYFCRKNGVVRYEQELHSELLNRNFTPYWGLIDESALRELHEEFISIDSRLSVEKLDMQNISEKLLEEHIVKSVVAANCTAAVAYQWMNGARFNFAKSSVKTHRARLRKIGIDIKNECDLSRFSPVTVKKATAVNVTPLTPPAWYAVPNNNVMRLVS